MTSHLEQIGISELPPTPSKFHYTFNLKDLSRICSGMLMIHTSLFTLPKQLVRVWRNEFTRCICDRLSSEQVRCFFKRINDDNSNALHTLKSQFSNEKEKKANLQQTRTTMKFSVRSFVFFSSSSSLYFSFSLLLLAFFFFSHSISWSRSC